VKCATVFVDYMSSLINHSHLTMSDGTASEGFWYFLITTVVAFLYFLVRFLYKSKCTTVTLGCLSYTRDIQSEMKGDMTTREAEAGGDQVV